MIKKNIKLGTDGNGIIVEVSNNKYFHDKDGNTKVFANLEIAKEVSKIFLPSASTHRKYYFLIDKKIIALDDCTKMQDYYQYINGDEVYYIEETCNSAVISIGYLCFENGDTVRCDKKYGMLRVKELMKYIRDISINFLANNYNNYGLKKIIKSNKEYILVHKDSSLKIHILQNSKLMDINQKRKEEGKNVLTFDKVYDKYTTFYVYTTRDVAEPTNKVDSYNVGLDIISFLVEDLAAEYPDITPKYIPLDLPNMKKIIVEENN